MADKKAKEDGKAHQSLVEIKFNMAVDMTGSFIKSIFPHTVKFFNNIKGVFKRDEPENKEN